MLRRNLSCLVCNIASNVYPDASLLDTVSNFQGKFNVTTIDGTTRKLGISVNCKLYNKTKNISTQKKVPLSFNATYSIP
jgi:hypothetical protein